MTSTPTIFQRVHLWTNAYDAVSSDPGGALPKLYLAGARVVVVQLQDRGPVPRSKVDSWKALGYKVFGAIRPSGDPLHSGLWSPTETAEWASSEKSRLMLNGMHFNFENEIQQADQSGTNWSGIFTARFRALRPLLPAFLTTYPVEGLNHAPYIAANFRLGAETFGNTNLWEWPPEWYVNAAGDGWAQRVGWPKGRIKILLPVHKIDGQRITVADAVAKCKASGVIGITLYPSDQAMDVLDEFLVPLVKGLISSGVAY